MQGKGGDAVKFRDIKRQLKLGKEPLSLLESARKVNDPYFSALSILEVALSERTERTFTEKLASESVELSSKVQAEWRRAELLSLIARKVSGSKDREMRSTILKSVLSQFRELPPGKGRSEGIKDLSPFLAGSELLDLALGNGRLAVSDAKVVLRAWTKKQAAADTLDRTIEMIGSTGPIAQRVELLGYLHLQLSKAGRKDESLIPLKQALVYCSRTQFEERERLIWYLSDNASFPEAVGMIEDAIPRDATADERTRILSFLASSYDKAGKAVEARKRLEEGLLVIETMDPHHAAELLSIYGAGFRRLGDADRSQGLFSRALAAAGDDEKLKRRILKGMDPEGQKRSEEKEPIKESPMQKGRNHILALYDAYEGGLGQVHARAIARAAPLCHAFSLDMALIGFPPGDLSRIKGLVLKDTNIGEEGRFVELLMEQGRIHLVTCTEKESPKDWSGLGLPVATSSHPDGSKRLGMDEAVKRALTEHPLGRVCLIMGLGKRGLPSSIMKGAIYHLELTGLDVPLETATAMGIMAYMLSESAKRVHRS